MRNQQIEKIAIEVLGHGPEAKGNREIMIQEIRRESGGKLKEGLERTISRVIKEIERIETEEVLVIEYTQEIMEPRAELHVA